MTFVCSSIIGFVILKIIYTANKKKQIQIEIKKYPNSIYDELKKEFNYNSLNK